MPRPRTPKASRAAAILCLVGAVNLPIIHFSVDWWNTLHQPASVSRLDAPALHPSMLLPLLVMALAFMAWFATVLLWRIEAALAGATDVLAITDRRGNETFVPTAKIAYVELGSADGARKIGFGD